MITLKRIDPDRNMARFYTLDVLPTLFGEWTLMAEWGRIGASGQSQRRAYPDEAAALAALIERLRRKTSRGYQSMSPMPPRADARNPAKHVSG